MQPLPELIAQAVAPHGLAVMGAAPDGSGTVVLLGADVGFWQVLTKAREYLDGYPDPVDRWSLRVVSEIADQFGAKPIFPFGGPPYAPFVDWAKASGRAWPSPVGMLVHDTAGLMISFRGAMWFSGALDWPKPSGSSPCETCIDRACTVACPIGALTGHTPYDLTACHEFLDTEAGETCMSNGCAARCACPVSRRFGRPAVQSAHHIRAFHHATLSASDAPCEVQLEGSDSTRHQSSAQQTRSPIR